MLHDEKKQHNTNRGSNALLILIQNLRMPYGRPSMRVQNNSAEFSVIMMFSLKKKKKKGK